jgi:hypothetical protein
MNDRFLEPCFLGIRGFESHPPHSYITAYQISSSPRVALDIELAMMLPIMKEVTGSQNQKQTIYSFVCVWGEAQSILTFHHSVFRNL